MSFFFYWEPLNTESFFFSIQEELDLDSCLFVCVVKIRILSFFYLITEEKKKNFDRYLLFFPIQEELDFDRCLFASAGNIRILSLFHLLTEEKKKNFDRCLFFSTGNL